MSAEKKHDYHLVDPSPWPIYVSFSCLVLAIGSIYYMHNDVSWGMYLGLALVFYGAYMWFRDVVIEAEHQGHHTPVVQLHHCLLYTSPSPRDVEESRMPSSA